MSKIIELKQNFGKIWPKEKSMLPKIFVECKSMKKVALSTRDFHSGGKSLRWCRKNNEQPKPENPSAFRNHGIHHEWISWQGGISLLSLWITETSSARSATLGDTNTSLRIQDRAKCGKGTKIGVRGGAPHGKKILVQKKFWSKNIFATIIFMSKIY